MKNKTVRLREKLEQTAMTSKRSRNGSCDSFTVAMSRNVASCTGTAGPLKTVQDESIMYVNCPEFFFFCLLK